MEIIQYISDVLIVVLFIELTFLILSNHKSQKKINGSNAILIDTSVLMDGRILSVAKANFINNQLVIPTSVVKELQLLADHSDAYKRMRARYGLDMISDLQNIKNLSVIIYNDEKNQEAEVDDELLRLAKDNGFMICTIDYNLNKVAKVDHLRVLNINELATNLRSNYLPGERAIVKLIDRGSEGNQAIGYLRDGTMVVVDNAKSKINHKVKIEIVKNLQTNAGRMIFAKLI